MSTDPLDDIDIARSSYRESDPEAEFINQPAEDNTSKNHIRSRLNEALNASNTTNSLATAGMNMTDNDVAFMNITDMGGSSAPNSPRASISSTLLQRPSSTTTRHRPHSASAQRPQSASARSSFHMRPSTAHAASSSRPSSSLAPAEALLGTAAAAVNVASLSSSLLASSGIDGGIATSGAVPPRPGSANARRASSNIVKHGINDIDPIQNSSSSRTRPAFVDSNEVSGGAPSDHYSYFYTEAELAAQAAASYEQQAHRSCCSRPSSSGQQRPLRPQSASQRAQAVRKGSTVNRFDMAHQTAPALSGLNVSVSAAPTTTQPGPYRVFFFNFSCINLSRLFILSSCTFDPEHHFYSQFLTHPHNLGQLTSSPFYSLPSLLLAHPAPSHHTLSHAHAIASVSPRNSVFGKPKVREQKSFADQLLSTAGSAGLQNDIISNPALKQENQDSVAVLQQMAKESMAQGKTDHTWGIFCTPGFVEALGVEKIYKSECHRSHQADDRLDAALKNVDLTHGLIKNDLAAWAENAIRTGRKVFMGAGGTMKM